MRLDRFKHISIHSICLYVRENLRNNLCFHIVKGYGFLKLTFKEFVERVHISKGVHRDIFAVDFISTTIFILVHIRFILASFTIEQVI